MFVISKGIKHEYLLKSEFVLTIYTEKSMTRRQFFGGH